jgi:hypothetical protein
MARAKRLLFRYEYLVHHPAKNIVWNRELSVSLRTGESLCKADVWLPPASLAYVELPVGHTEGSEPHT